jgi:hypothetical protein
MKLSRLGTWGHANFSSDSPESLSDKLMKGVWLRYPHREGDEEQSHSSANLHITHQQKVLVHEREKREENLAVLMEKKRQMLGTPTLEIFGYGKHRANSTTGILDYDDSNSSDDEFMVNKNFIRRGSADEFRSKSKFDAMNRSHSALDRNITQSHSKSGRSRSTTFSTPLDADISPFSDELPKKKLKRRSGTGLLPSMFPSSFGDANSWDYENQPSFTDHLTKTTDMMKKNKKNGGIIVSQKQERKGASKIASKSDANQSKQKESSPESSDIVSTSSAEENASAEEELNGTDKDMNRKSWLTNTQDTNPTPSITPAVDNNNRRSTSNTVESETSVVTNETLSAQENKELDTNQAQCSSNSDSTIASKSQESNHPTHDSAVIVGFNYDNGIPKVSRRVLPQIITNISNSSKDKLSVSTRKESLSHNDNEGDDAMQGSEVYSPIAATVTSAEHTKLPSKVTGKRETSLLIEVDNGKENEIVQEGTVSNTESVTGQGRNRSASTALIEELTANIDELLPEIDISQYTNIEMLPTGVQKSDNQDLLLKAILSSHKKNDEEVFEKIRDMIDRLFMDALERTGKAANIVKYREQLMRDFKRRGIIDDKFINKVLYLEESRKKHEYYKEDSMYNRRLKKVERYEESGKPPAPGKSPTNETKSVGMWSANRTL